MILCFYFLIFFAEISFQLIRMSTVAWFLIQTATAGTEPDLLSEVKILPLPGSVEQLFESFKVATPGGSASLPPC